MLDLLKEADRDVIAVGKIFDIFDGQGVTEKIKTTGNTNGIAFTKALQTRDFEGLAFVNLVDFDMLYGHTREYVPYLVCGKGVKPGVNLGTRLCFGTIAQTVCEYLGVDASSLDGHSVLQEILK